MEMTDKIYLKNRKEWRSWLSKNHDKKKRIWLIYYRKCSGKPRIPYNDAVEEALCYGWIDSTVKRIDDKRFAQKFTPRRATSMISEMNKERVRRLIKKKRMTSFGMKAIAHVFDGRSETLKKSATYKLIIKEIKKDKSAWKHFKDFPESYRRVRLAYIEEWKGYDENMFKKSLANFIKKTSKNKRFGMMRD